MTTATGGVRGMAALLYERIDAAARPGLDVREIAGSPVIEPRLPRPFHTVFTTRLGGVSEGPYASLNLDPRSEDDPARVAANRRSLAGALGGGPSGPRLVSPRQVHGVRVVGAAEYVSDNYGADLDVPTEHAADAGCDGLTLHPVLDRDLAALLLFADCVPVVLIGEVDMAVAHGGWRGILGGVVQQAARAMTGPPGTAIIGPSIGPCCFAVGSETAEAFAARFGPRVVVRGREGDEGQDDDAPPDLRVDLWAAVAAAASEIGIGPDRVINPRLCTFCNHDLFFSYRKEGPTTGRHGCLAWTDAT